MLPRTLFLSKPSQGVLPNLMSYISSHSKTTFAETVEDAGAATVPLAGPVVPAGVGAPAHDDARAKAVVWLA